MPQFSVHRNPNPATQTAIPLLLDVQNDLLGDLGTRVVIPLYRLAALDGQTIQRLMPRLEIDNDTYVAVTSELAGIPRKSLGAKVADVSDRRDEIVGALDFLFTGI